MGSAPEVRKLGARGQSLVGAGSIGCDTKAIGPTGGDGVHQVDAAVAIDHDRLAGLSADDHDEDRYVLYATRWSVTNPCGVTRREVPGSPDSELHCLSRVEDAVNEMGE